MPNSEELDRLKRIRLYAQDTLDNCHLPRGDGSFGNLMSIRDEVDALIAAHAAPTAADTTCDCDKAENVLYAPCPVCLARIREEPAAADTLTAALTECRKQLTAIIDDGIQTDFRAWRDDIDAVLAHITPTAADTPVAWPSLRDVANAINRARYGADEWRARDVEAEDKSSAEYAYRLAKAAFYLFDIAQATSPHPVAADTGGLVERWQRYNFDKTFGDIQPRDDGSWVKHSEAAEALSLLQADLSDALRRAAANLERAVASDQQLAAAHECTATQNELIGQVWVLLGGQDMTREGGQNLVGRVGEMAAALAAAHERVAELDRLIEELPAHDNAVKMIAARNKALYATKSELAAAHEQIAELERERDEWATKGQMMADAAGSWMGRAETAEAALSSAQETIRAMREVLDIVRYALGAHMGERLAARVDAALTLAREEKRDGQ